MLRLFKSVYMYFKATLIHFESNIGFLTSRISTNMEEPVKSLRYLGPYLLHLDTSFFSNGLFDSQQNESTKSEANILKYVFHYIHNLSV